MLYQVVALLVVICSYFYWARRANARKIATLDAKKQYNEIVRLLCTQEFPFEWYYGINIAFYRTFSSVSISGVYYSTGTIEKTGEKRVVDTDIIMWRPCEYGVDSELGKESLLHLNKIHGAFKSITQNKDFVYVLCCFIKDIMRMIEIVGWRKLTDHEKQAVFNFWIRYGEVMEITDLPKTLDAALQLVDDYVDHERLSRKTKGGEALTAAINGVLFKWFWGIPDFIMYRGITALLYCVGGPTFVDKLGLPTPHSLMVNALLGAGYLWGCLLSILPPRRTYMHSEDFYSQYYTGGMPCPGKKLDIHGVGPVNVLEKINN